MAKDKPKKDKKVKKTSFKQTGWKSTKLPKTCDDQTSDIGKIKGSEGV